jgi:hypothetical protein
MTGASTWTAVAVFAAATVGGAAFAGALRHSHRIALQLAATALLAVVALDLAPDIARDVADTGSARPVVGVACLVAFAAAAIATRWICACGTHPSTTTGLAIALHRTLEGAALALVGSAGVVVALVLHAAGEGFALQTYGARRAGRVWPLLVLACLSPAVGAAALGNVDLPPELAPVVTALIAGALVAGAARMMSAPWPVAALPAAGSEGSAALVAFESDQPVEAVTVDDLPV